jgi:hypothetical protein
MFFLRWKRWIESELSLLGQMRREETELRMRVEALEFEVATKRQTLPLPPQPPPLPETEPEGWEDDDLETECWYDVEPEDD